MGGSRRPLSDGSRATPSLGPESGAPIPTRPIIRRTPISAASRGEGRGPPPPEKPDLPPPLPPPPDRPGPPPPLPNSFVVRRRRACPPRHTASLPRPRHRIPGRARHHLGPLDQLEALHARARVVAEHAQHRARGREEFCFSTPRIDMRRCVASIATATPRGSIFSQSVSAISLVRRAWICRRRAKMWTRRGIC